MSTFTPLSTLAEIISFGVKALESAYSAKGLSFPSLEDVFHPTALDLDPELAQNTKIIVAAAAQIIASVRMPFETLLDYSSGSFTTALLGLVVDNNVPDILSEAGEKGAHVEQLSAATGVEASYLARSLRYLATRHVFQELRPDVFTNNRLSSLLVKTKNIEEIKAEPVARFDGAPLASMISMQGDEVLKGSAFLASFIENPVLSASPFNLALKTDAKVWEWYDEPGNEWRMRRFTAVWVKLVELKSYTGIDGNSLKAGDIVVDVGGSTDSVTLTLAKAFLHLKFVVQDLENQITEAKKLWENAAPAEIASGKVKLQVHNFFDPQPVKGATLYFLRAILHDWPDEKAKRILSELRSSASESSKLVIFDYVATHVCDDSSDGALSTLKFPYPLLPNLGVAGGGFITGADMMMLTAFNGKERTVQEFRDLGNFTGWKLETIKPGKMAIFVFAPALHEI